VFRIITVSRNSRRIVRDQQEDLMYKLLEFGKLLTRKDKQPPDRTRALAAEASFSGGALNTNQPSQRHA